MLLDVLKVSLSCFYTWRKSSHGALLQRCETWLITSGQCMSARPRHQWSESNPPGNEDPGARLQPQDRRQCHEHRSISGAAQSGSVASGPLMRITSIRLPTLSWTGTFHPLGKSALGRGPHVHRDRQRPDASCCGRVPFTPANASWRNLVKLFVVPGTTRKSRRGTHRTVNRLIQSIDDSLIRHNALRKPFHRTANAIERLTQAAHVYQWGANS